MINFTRIDGPAGIPIYYQHMPDLIRSVSISLLVFTGAGDDRAIGEPGLYHWFEHVPFRGTKKYPRGQQDFHNLIGRFGGHINAWTSKNVTCFTSFAPLVVWQECLSVIVDLFAQPLITDEGVNAEREIIHQEILDHLGDAGSVYGDRYFRMAFRQHVFEDPVLGTKETLGRMNADTLRAAHANGYDRKRISLFVSGNVSPDEFYEELEKLVGIMPLRDIPARSQPVAYGKVVWPTDPIGLYHSEQTNFKPSMTTMSFRLPDQSQLENFRLGRLVSGLLGFGGLSSPLARVVREERRLVYGVEITRYMYPEVTLIDLDAMSGRSNIDEIRKAYLDVLADDSVWSMARVEEIHTAMKFESDMRPASPQDFVEEAINRFISAGGHIVNDNDRLRMWETVTELDLMEARQIFNPDRSRHFIFQGTE